MIDLDPRGASNMCIRPESSRRPGFTLVELLVSMALILFIMTILAEAFSSGTETFRRLKGIGDLQERLRTASTILKRDLAADHFQGKTRLSDPNFWVNGPPEEGFFRLYQGSTPPAANKLGQFPTSQNLNYQIDGVDLSGPPTFRTVDHAIHMMVKYRGNSPGDMFSTSIPGNSTLLLAFNNGYGTDSRFQATQNIMSAAPARRPIAIPSPRSLIFCGGKSTRPVSRTRPMERWGSIRCAGPRGSACRMMV